MREPHPARPRLLRAVREEPNVTVARAHTEAHVRDPVRGRQAGLLHPTARRGAGQHHAPVATRERRPHVARLRGTARVVALEQRGRAPVRIHARHAILHAHEGAVAQVGVGEVGGQEADAAARAG